MLAHVRGAAGLHRRPESLGLVCRNRARPHETRILPRALAASRALDVHQRRDVVARLAERCRLRVELRVRLLVLRDLGSHLGLIQALVLAVGVREVHQAEHGLIDEPFLPGDLRGGLTQELLLQTSLGLLQLGKNLILLIRLARLGFQGCEFRGRRGELRLEFHRAGLVRLGSLLRLRLLLRLALFLLFLCHLSSLRDGPQPG